jgi:hypothetical protein
MKKLSLAVVLLGAALAFAAGKTSKFTRSVPADDLKWAPLMETNPNGPMVAFVDGDPKSKGQVQFFLKFPVGFDSGWHTHDGNYTAVVVKGKKTHQGQGDAAETVQPVGSWWARAGKENHRDGCAKDSPSECVIYVQSEKGFSFHPMTADGSPAKAEAPAKADAK